MDYMSLKRTGRAEAHLLSAWALARPDGLIKGFGEHHGGGMLEAVIKPRRREEFRRIIDITYRFSAGWRRVHNPLTGHPVADGPTTTEFAVSMLAARGWSNRDIAAHLRISGSTVKRHGQAGDPPAAGAGAVHALVTARCEPFSPGKRPMARGGRLWYDTRRGPLVKEERK